MTTSRKPKLYKTYESASKRMTALQILRPEQNFAVVPGGNCMWAVALMVDGNVGALCA